MTLTVNGDVDVGDADGGIVHKKERPTSLIVIG